MTAHHTFITSGDVAHMIGLSDKAAFLRKRRHMEKNMDFPQPMPHAASPLLWRADEITAWLDRQGRPASSQGLTATTQNTTLIELARQA